MRMHRNARFTPNEGELVQQHPHHEDVPATSMHEGQGLQPPLTPVHELGGRLIQQHLRSACHR